MKILFILASVILMATPAAIAQMAPPIPVTASQFANGTIGQAVTVAVRVEGLARTQLDADLLERITDSRYHATRTHVTIYLAPDTPFVMGSVGDLKRGAILFVYGVITGAARADAKRVIVVTPYATVE